MSHNGGAEVPPGVFSHSAATGGLDDDEYPIFPEEDDEPLLTVCGPSPVDTNHAEFAAVFHEHDDADAPPDDPDVVSWRNGDPKASAPSASPMVAGAEGEPTSTEPCKEK